MGKSNGKSAALAAAMPEAKRSKKGQRETEVE